MFVREVNGNLGHDMTNKSQRGLGPTGKGSAVLTDLSDCKPRWNPLPSRSVKTHRTLLSVPVIVCTTSTTSNNRAAIHQGFLQPSFDTLAGIARSETLLSKAHMVACFGATTTHPSDARPALTPSSLSCAGTTATQSLPGAVCLFLGSLETNWENVRRAFRVPGCRKLLRIMDGSKHSGA